VTKKKIRKTNTACFLSYVESTHKKVNDLSIKWQNCLGMENRGRENRKGEGEGMNMINAF
jgi:hypothetical protein